MNGGKTTQQSGSPVPKWEVHFTPSTAKNRGLQLVAFASQLFGKTSSSVLLVVFQGKQSPESHPSPKTAHLTNSLFYMQNQPQNSLFRESPIGMILGTLSLTLAANSSSQGFSTSLRVFQYPNRYDFAYTPPQVSSDQQTRVPDRWWLIREHSPPSVHGWRENLTKSTNHISAQIQLRHTPHWVRPQIRNQIYGNQSGSSPHRRYSDLERILLSPRSISQNQSHGNQSGSSPHRWHSDLERILPSPRSISQNQSDGGQSSGHPQYR